MKRSDLTIWFRSKPQREQALLVAVGLVLILYAFWFVLLQPLLQARDVSARRVLQSQESLLMVSELAAALQQARQAAPSASDQSRNLAQWLDESSTQQGLVISALEPAADNRSVTVRMDTAAMTDVLAWLLGLERTGWIAIESVAITPNRVDGEVSLSLRARLS